MAIDFNSLMERIIPFDETLLTKDTFLYLISVTYPELEETLKQKLNEKNEWTKKASEGEPVYFSIYDSFWKKKVSNKRPNAQIYLDYIESMSEEKKLAIKVTVY